MSPDLDLANQIKLVSIRGFFTFPFRAYAKFFRHRGLSHSIIFGTLTRILWLGLIGLGIFFAIYKAVPKTQDFLSFFFKHKAYILTGLAGVFFADMCHLLLDWKGP